MKKLLTLAFLLFAPSAWAQCNGVFPANTLCGNLGASPAPPAAFSAAGTIVGPSSSTSSFIATWSNNLGTQLGSFNTISTSQAVTFTGVTTFTSASTFTNITSFNALTTFSGLTNFTSQFQIGGQRMQFPASADTVGGLGTNQTWTGNNTFNGATAISSLSVSGNISLTNPLSAANGGTGRTSLFVPTTQSFTAGTSLTYTTPSNPTPTYIVIDMCGGGAGGGAQATNNGTAGTSTVFATWVAGAGQGGPNGGAAGAGGAGGTGGANGSGTQIIRQAGGRGSGSSNGGSAQLGFGGISFVGGYGALPQGGGAAGLAPQANSCGGGSGGGNPGVAAAGGGGAGEFVRFQITAPASAYTYTVGAQGVGGAAGTNAGGLGTSGFVLVREYYQ